MILQESEDSALILAICSYECYKSCEKVKFGDRIEIEAEIMKKNDSNEVTKIWIDTIQKTEKDGQDFAPHSIASMPFCNKPRFIHELSNVDIKKTVLQATILDLKMTVYEGCVHCQHVMKTVSSKAFCPKCKRKIGRDMTFGKMRVMDFSGQLYVNVKTEAMKKILDIFGFADDQWNFSEPRERANYIFQNIMLEIEMESDEWECTDAAEMNWDVHAKYLEKKEEKENRREEEEVQARAE
ncbi:hypothetical protein B9Z55_023578 [Caenorhabditis nigoni]|uniref:Replication factor A C-terminal domain-containing protein n=1 Tax=Caenorhabditis nigoni TaxID=1611254 RepID=A0A2G5SQM1_9PELO|nr:hypothetical protein B9Z55_023578 [Caenorhabditis nigoni]